VPGVFDVQIDEEIEGVFDGVAAYEEGFGSEDDVGWIDGDVFYGDFGDLVRGDVEQDRDADAKDEQRGDDGGGQVAASGLCEGKGHWFQGTRY
jgi:hypothetical protein